MTAPADCWTCQDENRSALAALLADVGGAEAAAQDNEPDPRGTTVRTWQGLLAPIGKPTGDGRRFAAGALTHAPLPSALRWQREDGQGHTRSVAIGTLDRVEYRDDGPWGFGIIFQPDPEKLPRLAEDVNEALMLLDQGVIGPSVDLDSMEFHALEQPMEPSMAELAAGEQRPETQRRPEIMVDKGRIRAATLVQIPAFAECGPFELGEMPADEYAGMVEEWENEREALAEQGEAFARLAHLPVEELDEIAALADEAAEEGLFGARFDKLVAKLKGNVSDPSAVAASIGRKKYGVKGMARLAAGVAASKVKPLTASADHWEDAMTAAAFGAEYVPAVPPKAWFEEPEADRPTPLTVTADGRVYGHLADWRTCHTGFANQCVKAPKSPSNYAYFHTGVTATDEGDLPIGKITLGTGHADLAFAARPAAEHYDNSGSAVAEVRAKDGKHGIWVSGRVIPGTPPEKVAELKRSPLSGDWRPIAGKREMIAALAVNSGGFPIPRQSLTSSAYGQLDMEGALVAAGVLAVEDPGTQPGTLGPEHLEQFARQVVATMRSEEQADERRSRARSLFAAMDEADETQEPLRRKLRARKAAQAVQQTQTGATGLAYAGDPGDLAAVAAFARRRQRPAPGASMDSSDADADDRRYDVAIGEVGEFGFRYRHGWIPIGGGGKEDDRAKLHRAAAVAHFSPHAGGGRSQDMTDEEVRGALGRMHPDDLNKVIKNNQGGGAESQRILGHALAVRNRSKGK